MWTLPSIYYRTIFFCHHYLLVGPSSVWTLVPHFLCLRGLFKKSLTTHLWYPKHKKNETCALFFGLYFWIEVSGAKLVAHKFQWLVCSHKKVNTTFVIVSRFQSINRLIMFAHQCSWFTSPGYFRWYQITVHVLQILIWRQPTAVFDLAGDPW